MIEYHLFEIYDKNYIYFPEYQQGFEISDKFAKYLEYTAENESVYRDNGCAFHKILFRSFLDNVFKLAEFNKNGGKRIYG